MAPSYGSLVKEAIVLLDRFSASRQCLDDFMEDAAKGLQRMDTLHQKFILDAVSGCVEHKKLLDVVINVFYGQNGECLSRGDRNQFVIICYLTTFALDNLGLQRFGNIVKSLDIKKMHTFLTFFFTHLNTWIQEEWNNIYDVSYVEKHWIEPLLRWRPEISILLDQLDGKISGGSQVEKAPIKTTKPQEFSLTKPKPPPLPVPEVIPQQEKCKPVPHSTYRAPKEIQTIAEIKQKNHRKAEELLYKANMKQFRCVNPQKSEHSKKVISQINEDLNSKLKFNSFHSTGPAPSKKILWPVKLNTAAILREKALHGRQVEEELQRVERLLVGEREPSSFLQWQREMREKDRQEELDIVERRHLEGRVSYKGAAMARTCIMEHNQRTAELKKEETAQLMRRYAEKRLQEDKEVRDLVQQVAEGHKNSKTAKEKIQKLKQSIVREVSEQNQELLRRALDEAQAELKRKFEIIHKIRAIESVPHIRVTNFDDTETAGHKLLGEMSLVELKERLALLRDTQLAEQQEKREHILEDRRKKKQLLSEQLDAIEHHRRVLAKAAAVRKKERKTRLDLRQAVTQDETVLALQRKLEEKQRERQTLKQRESERAKSLKAAAHCIRNTETPNRKSPKKKTWEELEQSLERYIQRDTL